ncbi:hypothetical protein GGTG_06105 [Gaeumannomyces tritici R3-111a-1]|uniref:Uncharacterized protein n=1 Tax=Gaeumannomyces tritici (strain R3-111a-1) TaxID=644352 RepID=J3NXV0_GAET3|nr:hypothetical protein GGTG_06105 [Gaeumannomyces tritici R3-111a-1]EJT76183.1 hypothetical protein GGTG_06105 [Gaeumannomyces tritici R3-111a-1]
MKVPIATILVAGLALPAVAAPIRSFDVVARTPGGGGGRNGKSGTYSNNGSNNTNGNYGNYGSYGTYSNYPTSYTTYGTYPSTYSTYGSYPSNYSTYGTYKRWVGWAKNLFAHSSADVETKGAVSGAVVKRRLFNPGPGKQEFPKFNVSRARIV